MLKVTKMKKLMAVAFGCSLILGVSNAQAKAEVEITWEKPKEYTDVKPTNQSRTRFREGVFKKLDEHFAELAERLPDGQKLSVTVTDLDLAGQVWPSSFVGLGSGAGSDVRLVKRIDIPRMEFSYTLTDANGAVIKKDDVKIKDMAFQDSIRGHSSNDTLRYEKNMIKEWFDDEFPKLVAKQ
jgi:hypothetical protein